MDAGEDRPDVEALPDIVPNFQDADAGQEQPNSCAAPFEDCDGDPLNGCETNTSESAQNCGGCGKVCNGSMVCEMTGCAFHCGPGYLLEGDRCVLLGVARPVAPQSLGRVTSMRPTFRWALERGGDGATVEVCADRACRTVLQTLSASGSFVRPADPLPPNRVLYWRLHAMRNGEVSPRTSATWLFRTPARESSAGTDTSTSFHSDVNGDGFEDVVALYPRVLLFGSASGLTAVGATPAQGMDPRIVNDVNGDGFAEVTTMDPYGVWFGGLDGASSMREQAWRMVGTTTVDSCGDANRDGFADMLIDGTGTWVPDGGFISSAARFLFRGSASGLFTVEPFQLSPRSVSVASGDFDGDGFSDTAFGHLGSPGSAPTPQLTVRFGGPSFFATKPDQPIEATSGTARLLANARDVNGDGYSDLFYSTSVPLGADGGPVGTNVNLIYGSAAGLQPASRRVWEGGYLIHYAALSGDFNGDGYSDVLAVRSEGVMATASVYFGRNEGIGATPDFTVTHNSFSGIATGDFNGDGYDDLFYARSMGAISDVVVANGGPSGLDFAGATVLR